VTETGRKILNMPNLFCLGVKGNEHPTWLVNKNGFLSKKMVF